MQADPGVLGRAFRAAFRAWGHRFARTQIARGLDGLYVQGLDDLRPHLERGPVLLAANHSSWWDALLLVELTRRLGVPCQVLVDEAQLRHHRFFSAFGAVGIDLADPRPGIEAAARALRSPGDILWVFPQGRYLPPHRRPLALKPGVQWIHQASGAAVVPVAMQYAFLQADRPAGFVRVGAPLGAGEELDPALAHLLDAIDDEVVERSAVALPADRATRWLSAIADALDGARG